LVLLLWIAVIAQSV